MKKTSLILALMLLAGASLAPSADAALILDVGPGGTAFPCNSCGAGGQTFGWAFDVTSTISVDGIGVWDAGADGIGPSVGAAIWTNAGILLASTTITNASSPEPSSGAGVWLFESISTLTLTPGRYVVGSVFFPQTPTAQFDTAFTTIPQITYVGGRQDLGGTGLDFPDFNFGPDGVFGPTLRVASAPVPEPATLSLLGLGLAALVSRRRSASVYRR